MVCYSRVTSFALQANLKADRSCTVEQAIKPCLHQIMKLLAQQPSLLSSLRVHLPRPRCLRALLDAEYVGRGKPPPPQVIPRDALPLTLPDTTVTQHIRPWLYWDMIQEMCQMQKQCMRRGCKNRRRARCGGCKMMEYCGHPCQKQCVFTSFTLTHPSIFHVIFNHKTQFTDSPIVFAFPSSQRLGGASSDMRVRT